MSPPKPRKHLVYFGDPMCSWCYGFEPVLRGVKEHFGERLPIGIVLGGLRPGTQRAMSSMERDQVRKHWDSVKAATSQKFDYSFFDRGRFVYDTEPACRAVIVYRRTQPDFAQEFFANLQIAFYADGKNITKPDVLATLADEHGYNAEAFLQAFHDMTAREETARDFQISQEAGVEGFPTLMAGSMMDGYQVAAHGFRPLDGLISDLENWLAETDAS